MNTTAECAERSEYLQLGDEVYDSIPMSEKLAHVGERIAIDLRTREYRFYDGSLPREALPITGPTWTSIIRLERASPMVWH